MSRQAVRVRVLALLAAASFPAISRAQTAVRWDPALRIAERARRAPRAVRSLFPGARQEGVGVALRFGAPPGSRTVRALERAGAVVARSDRTGRVLWAGPLLGAFVPWGRLEAVAAVPGLVRIALGRAPGEQPPMDLSVPEIGASRAWSRHAPDQGPLTGRGMILADVDTGIDLRHPMFFFADGGHFAWLDVDGNGAFTDGVDAVDLDGEGDADPEETLRLQDARRFGTGGGRDGHLQAGEDWLWADADGNGQRDWGLAGGYDEEDPCLGERFLIVDDADRDDVLDPGETLTALGTPKVIGIYGFPGRTYLRGENLLEAPLDDLEHGTGVTSVAVGGWPRAERRFGGVAPEAELLVATRGSTDSGVVVTVPWAIEQGADVVLYEYGAIAARFLDGSDEDDQLVDEIARMGVPQVTPTGNWGDSGKTLRATIGGEGRLDEVVQIPADWEVAVLYLTLRWRRPEVPLDVVLTSPSGTALALQPATEEEIDGLHFVVEEDVSDRGTLSRSVLVYRADDAPLELGDWSLVVTNPDPAAVVLQASVIDDRSGFSGGVRFGNWFDPLASAASPSTADLALAVGSYSTRPTSGADVTGQLSGFSGRGARIDGTAIVDVVAPGDFDVFWAHSARDEDEWGGFSLGGGTSAAGPHVAGALLLLRQARPDAGLEAWTRALASGALVDSFVGIAPNESWGAGKLRIGTALDALGPAPEPPVADAGVDAAVDAAAPAPPDAGTDAAPDAAVGPHPEQGGCGCSTRPRARAGAGVLGPVVVALGVMIRRARRRSMRPAPRG